MRRLVAIIAGLLLCISSASTQVPMTGAGKATPTACIPSTALNYNFTSGGLPAGITFTRASAGSYFNSSNILQVNGATTNTARFDYTISGNTQTLLYEPAATNLFVQSNNWGATWFGINGGTAATTGVVNSPDGTADAWNQVGVVSAFSAIAQGVTYNGTSTYVESLYVMKNLAIDTFALGINGSLVNFTATTSWTRYNNPTLTPSAGSNNTFAVDSVGSAAFNLYVAFAQLEVVPASLATPGPTSYFPTTTVTLTRAADQATFAIPSCVGHLTVTFIDNTTQSITVTPGAGSYTLTNSLNLFNIKTIVGAP